MEKAVTTESWDLDFIIMVSATARIMGHKRQLFLRELTK